MAIPHSLLGLLAEKPSSASELRRRFEQSTGQLWPLNQGQVSQTLQRLQRDGFVEKRGETTGERGHTTDLFAITPQGADELAQWWARPALPVENQRDELVMKVVLSKALHGPRAKATARLIQSQREAVMEQLRQTMRQLRDMPPEATAPRLLLERKVFNLEAENRWLDHIETLKDPQS